MSAALSFIEFMVEYGVKITENDNQLSAVSHQRSEAVSG